ncbi:hypothetical protein AB0C02_29255 [Micromonospora sp. NPDC048999]|uniref:hypothetical protein n=1 Tax=Micromonospora sp. NPDC048999 TaxID=3155391 RepID=UPI0033ED954C
MINSSGQVSNEQSPLWRRTLRGLVGGTAGGRAADSGGRRMNRVPRPASFDRLPVSRSGGPRRWARQPGERWPRGAYRGRSPQDDAAQVEFHLERYRYILQQIHAANENVLRFLGIYQALATTLVGAALALFVGHQNWGIPPATARAGILALLWLVTVVAAFTVLLVIVGVLTWLDYRNEECQLLSDVLDPTFRAPPNLRNFYRWYETYIIAFIVVTVGAMWWCALELIIPAIQM